MTEPSESPERLFQQLDNLVADIIDQFASQGHETAVAAPCKLQTARSLACGEECQSSYVLLRAFCREKLVLRLAKMTSVTRLALKGSETSSLL